MSSSDTWFLDDPQPYRLEREGIVVDVPTGWDCRIGKQFETGDGERSFLVLHATTRPLQGLRADYGGGVVEKLGTRDVFIALIEFGPTEANSALYKGVESIPTLELAQFRRNQLQRRIPGQGGVQHFFTISGRPFCLYVVLGSIANGRQLVLKANEMLSVIEVGTR